MNIGGAAGSGRGATLPFSRAQAHRPHVADEQTAMVECGCRVDSHDRRLSEAKRTRTLQGRGLEPEIAGTGASSVARRLRQYPMRCERDSSGTPLACANRNYVLANPHCGCAAPSDRTVSPVGDKVAPGCRKAVAENGPNSIDAELALGL